MDIAIRTFLSKFALKPCCWVAESHVTRRHDSCNHQAHVSGVHQLECLSSSDYEHAICGNSGNSGGRSRGRSSGNAVQGGGGGDGGSNNGNNANGGNNNRGNNSGNGGIASGNNGNGGRGGNAVGGESSIIALDTCQPAKVLPASNRTVSPHILSTYQVAVVPTLVHSFLAIKCGC